MISRLQALVQASTRDMNRSFLSALGLVALADLRVIQYRTALTGSASFLDTFLLAPGLHRQQAAAELNNAEYPAVGAMTTGYIFRVENQATVSWLLDIGRTAQLTTVEVLPPSASSQGVFPSVPYLAGVALTAAVFSKLVAIEDWWALGALSVLMLARLLNVIIIKRRTKLGWKGYREKEDTRGDLIILLSQDRWVRLRGYVNDLKIVTSGCWLADMSPLDILAVNLGTILTYISPALSSNATTTGNVLICGLLLASAALIGICNTITKDLNMFGRTVRVVGRKEYDRRLTLAHELIEETGRDDWAIGLGMITPPKGKEGGVVVAM
ncbi:hypothetical protein PHLGIDRAFT_252141 [Phlebiopsis gigantea 11061_1 CR5-6]|uniref:Uncharacterized protein n=1 Tax=Phlebiopsis gigantea (strain 11061_1 CR5-6) TaxID=745531 RepID=A0A0C3PDA8_PHLG1|nr:hypothetical protein PHLGIDRAFT_252141 [Phlebiopsis gigantea 11061_1 CR5-6]